MELLQLSALLPVILPEAVAFDAQSPQNDSQEAALRWQSMLLMLNHLAQPSFATALAALLRPLCQMPEADRALAETICRRWKLANEEIDVVCHLLRHEATIRAAPSIPWPQLQRILIAPHAGELLEYCSAVCRVMDSNDSAVAFCRQKLSLPLGELNPPPLLTGNDLKQLGLSPGPRFKQLLDALRDAQLDKMVQTRDQALDFVKNASS
jgi:hypothetical protein